MVAEAVNWEDANAVKTATTTAAEVTGLTAQTNYKFYLRAVCKTEGYSSVVTDAFKTDCGNITELPYSCGFETADGFANGAYHECWKAIGTPAAYNYYYKTGSLCLRVNGTAEQYVVLPAFEKAVKDLQISFWYKNYYPTSYASTLTLGTMTNPADAETFTTIKALDATADYVNVVEEILAGAPATDHYIAFKYTGGNTYSAVYLDDITVELAPTCKNPIKLAQGVVTAKTAAFTWTAGGDETQWQAVAAVAGQEPVWDGVEPINTAAVTLSELTPATAYTIYVRSYCAADEQSKVVSLNFTTECEAITVDAEHPWKENFNAKTAGEFPQCWDAVDANETNKVTIAVYAGDQWLTLNDNALRFNGKNSYGYGYALLPPFTNELNTLQIAFAHKAEHSSNSGKIELGYYKDGEFQTLQAYDQSTTMKNEDAYPLASVPAGARLAFAYKSNSGYDYAAVVDNIEVSLIPTCPVPTAITISDSTATGAKVAWTSDADSIALQYRADEVDGWTDAENVTNPFTLTGLDEQTKYWVRVKAACGENFESEWSTPVAFTTLCAAKTIGYSEEFSETLDACWDNSDKNGMYTWEPYSEDLENYRLRYRASNNVYAYAALTTPAFALPADKEAALLFDWENTGVTGVSLTIKAEGEEGVSLSDELNTELSKVGSGLKKASLLAYKGKTVVFILRASGSASSGYAYLDNFQVIEKPCLVPANLEATPGVKSAIVTWEAAWDETAWNLKYRPVGDNPEADWTNVANLTERTYQITELEDEKEYEVQVQAACGGEWTDSVTFTTLENQTTAISNTNAKTTATKRIVNGQLIIELNGESYSAQGVNIR